MLSLRLIWLNSVLPKSIYNNTSIAVVENVKLFITM